MDFFTGQALLQLRIHAVAWLPYASWFEVEDDEGMILFSGTPEPAGLESIGQALINAHRRAEVAVGMLPIFVAHKDLRREVFRGLMPAVFACSQNKVTC